MIIKKGFILKKLNENTANELNVVIAVGDVGKNINGYIKLNESAVLLWNRLLNDATIEQLVDVLLCEFDVDEETARNDVLSFIKILKSIGALDE